MLGRRTVFEARLHAQHVSVGRVELQFVIVAEPEKFGPSRDLPDRGVGVLPASEDQVGDLSMYGSELARAFRTTPEFKAIQDGMVQKCAIKRVGTPADIGQAVVFLASDCASYITGQTLHVTGGLIN